MAAERSRAVRTLLAVAALCGCVALVSVAPTRAQAQAITAQAQAQAQTQASDADLPPANIEPKRDAFWLGAGLAFGVLNLPKLGVGIKALAEVRPRRFWPLVFGLTYWFDNEVELNEKQLDLGLHPLVAVVYPADGSRLSVRAFQASASTCPYEHELASGALTLCAGMEGGVVHVSGAGFVNEQAEARATFAFDAYARWHFDFGSSDIGVTYSLGVFVPVLRDRFGYRDRSGVFREQFRIAPVGGQLDLALTYGF